MNKVPGCCGPEDVFIRTISLDGILCGLAVTVRAYPNPQTVFLALLLIVESAQGQFLGTRVLRHIEGESKSWGCSSISAAVDSHNVRALKFWLREGFVERFRKKMNGFVGQAIAIEKKAFRPIG
jgi:GNAT superfamily N-acetyltransferase